ncbi:MAG TPA: hypothetical protein PKD52_00170 [Clostridiales bacterium]|nr:hypothetical protein [Clostridiales bacterium]
MAYEKLYNEIYAIVVLKYFWEDYKPGYIKWESPDWLNKQEQTGIEVSQALLPYDGQAEHFIEHFLGRPREEIPEVAFQKYGDRLYFYNGRLWALLNDENDPFGYQEKILTRFSRKLDKLNSHYHPCGFCALYLYTHAEPTGEEIQGLMEKMAQEQSRRESQFDTVFLDCGNRLFLLNFSTNRAGEIPLPDKALEFITAETDELYQTVLWDKGTVFGS